MSGKGYAVRLHAIDGDSAATAQALSRVFGIDIQTAAQVLQSLPRIVKHDASQEDAERIAAALQTIGARVEVFAKPLQPVRVMIVGTPQPASRQPPAPANTQILEAGQSPAIPWGGLDLESLTPKTARVQSARLPPMASAAPDPRPEPVRADAPLELAPVSARAPVRPPAHALERVQLPAQVVARDHSPLPNDPPPSAAGTRDRFTLPDDPPPSAAVPAVRPASARLHVKPRPAAGAPAAGPVRAPEYHVVAAHPVARFLLALGATSAVFLLTLALL